MNTPFQWGKQVASHFGGTRNPLVVSWPERIKDEGEVRDAVPSLHRHRADDARSRERAATAGGERRLAEADRRRQHGLQLRRREGEGRRGTQYFEMFGNRAVYHDGWVAVCRHGRLPWNQGSADFADDKWELYNIDDDFSEANDLAARTRTSCANCRTCSGRGRQVQRAAARRPLRRACRPELCGRA